MLSGLGRDFGDEVGPIDEEHARTFSRGAEGDAAADPLGGSGDDHHLAGEATGEDHAATVSGWMLAATSRNSSEI